MKDIHKRGIFGFVMPELLVVLGILTILLAIAFSVYRVQVAKAKDAQRKSDIDRIRIAAEEYEKDHNCYPPPSLMECNPGTGLRPYIDKIPCDPSTGKSYTYETDGKACSSWYRIYAALQNPQDTDIKKLGCTYGCGPGFAYNYYSSSPNAPKPPAATSPRTPGPSGTPEPTETPGVKPTPTPVVSTTSTPTPTPLSCGSTPNGSNCYGTSAACGRQRVYLGLCLNGVCTDPSGYNPCAGQANGTQCSVSSCSPPTIGSCYSPCTRPAKIGTCQNQVCVTP